ncbi:MAG: 1,4-dihydroxy-2-naphthoate polyprenyltransferase [Polyangiales bacterium]
MSDRPSRAAIWVMACRPATLTAAVVPVLVGAAVAWRAAGAAGVRWGALTAALLGAVFIQIGTNLANDVFDHEKGADTAERLGPTRVTQAGLLTAAEVRRGMVVAFGLAVAAGAYLVAVGGPVIVAIGLASIASGIAYTGGPYPLGYNGLGDVFVFVFFGLVAVCGTAFVATGALPMLAWLAAVPVGALATAVLVVNNVRDRSTDVRAGKRTLVVRFGRAFGVAEYAGLWLLAAGATAGMAAWLRTPWVLLPLVTLPLGAKLARTVATVEGAPLNATLAATAKALLAFGSLLAVGLAVG